MGGVVFLITLPLYHLFRNSYHPEKQSISFINFFRKCGCIRSYLPTSSNLLKKSCRKTSLFVLTKTAVMENIYEIDLLRSSVLEMNF